MHAEGEDAPAPTAAAAAAAAAAAGGTVPRRHAGAPPPGGGGEAVGGAVALARTREGGRGSAVGPGTRGPLLLRARSGRGEGGPTTLTLNP